MKQDIENLIGLRPKLPLEISLKTMQKIAATNKARHYQLIGYARSLRIYATVFNFVHMKS